MRCALAFLTLLLLALGHGCRGLPWPAARPAAQQVRVGQLVFHCNFELLPDEPLVRELKNERESIAAALGLPPSDRRIDVYLFRDANSYRDFLSRRFPSVPARRAFFVETDQRLEVYAHWSERVGEDLRHEVAHGYLHSMVRGLPLWLDEGLAEYFEVPRGSQGLNRPHLELLADLMHYNGWRPSLARLETLNEAAQMDQRDYAEAWAWVYFMLHSDAESRAALTAYLADLRLHGVSEPLPARLTALGTKPELALVTYLQERRDEVIAGKENLQIAK